MSRDYIAELLLREIEIEKNRISYLVDMYGEALEDATGLLYQIGQSNEMIKEYVETLVARYEVK